MSPTRNAAALLLVLALAAPFVASWLVALALVALVAATLTDALLVKGVPELRREAPSALVRGQAGRLALELAVPPRGRAHVRQPVGPDLRLSPGESDVSLEATLVPRRRGRHPLPAPAVRLRGPLALGSWTRTVGQASELRVYPDLPAARRLAARVRQGRFRAEGRRSRGPLGLGTDFESLRDYAPDDDVRQVNWLATARLGRPISNQYRLERDRDVICLVDCGRLSAAPIGAATRLDLALDATVAVAAVAEELGDRCGAIAFDAQLRRSLPPRRAGLRGLVESLYDLEPVALESDYELAFQALARAKRAFALVFTDLVEPGAARPLLDALPVLAAHHAVAVASVADPALSAALATEPREPRDAYRLAVALEVLDARATVASGIRRAGGEVIEAAPDRLSAACVSAYLRAKARGRL